MQLSFGACVIDTDRRELTRDGAPVDIQRQVFDVLLLLITNSDRVVPKEELLDEIWGSRFVSESALTTRIKEARRAVGDDGARQRMIKTVHGVGYRAVGAVAVVSSGDGDHASAVVPMVAGPSRPPERPRTYYADSGGASIAYQTFGTGPDLVLVSGFTTNVEVQWEHPAIASFLEQLGSFARVTVFDKRSVGCSERTAADEVPSLEVRADDLCAVISAAGIERATVLGSSEGGSLAALFAALHPDLVDRLVLHGTWVRGREWVEGELDVVADRWGKGVVYQSLCPTLGSTTAGREFLARYERQSATPRAARSIVEMIREIDITGPLASISAPTLILHRVDDDIVPFSHARQLHELIEGSELVAIEGSDHGVFSGDATAILDAVERFVTGSTGRSPDLERQLATVLFVDLVDSTATLAEVGDARWARQLDEFYAIARRAVVGGRGEVVNTIGDGIVAVFDGPGRAIRAAAELRDDVTAIGLRARSGLHTAEVDRRGDDVTGIGVHIASRVASHAAADEVLVSRTVTDLVAGNGLVFESRGTFDLKGVARPWELFALVS